jgi:hypothetical protein
MACLQTGALLMVAIWLPEDFHTADGSHTDKKLLKRRYKYGNIVTNNLYRPIESSDDNEDFYTMETSLDETTHGKDFKSESKSEDCDVAMTDLSHLEEESSDSFNSSHCGDDDNSFASSSAAVSLDLFNSISISGGSSVGESVLSDTNIYKKHSILCTNGKKQKPHQNVNNRVKFCGMVTVKTINSAKVEYSALKNFVKEDDDDEAIVGLTYKPPFLGNSTADISPNKMESNSLEAEAAVVTENYPVFSNGSEYCEDIDLSRWGLLSTVITKRPIILCIVIYFLIGVSLALSLELFQIWFSMSFFSNAKNSLFTVWKSALLETTYGFLTTLLVIFAIPYAINQLGTLQTFRFNLLNILYLSCIFVFLPAGLGEYGLVLIEIIQLFLFLFLMASYACLLLIGLTFLYNSAYSHEKALVFKLGTLFLCIGMGIGSFLGGLMFYLVEIFRSYWSIKPYIEWTLNVFLSYLIRMFALQLPKKIQRPMREPTKPRYAKTMYRDEDGSDMEDFSFITNTNH